MDKISYYNSDSYSDEESSVSSVRSPSPEPMPRQFEEIARQAQLSARTQQEEHSSDNSHTVSDQEELQAPQNSSVDVNMRESPLSECVEIPLEPEAVQ